VHIPRTRARAGAGGRRRAHRRLERGAARMKQRPGERDARKRRSASACAPKHGCNRWRRIADCRGAGSTLWLGRRVLGLSCRVPGHAGAARPLLPS
jgi:hypothetical protein